jgi:hypothetical protein
MLVLPQLVFHVRAAVPRLPRLGVAQLIQASDWPAWAVERELGWLVRPGFVDPLPPDC